MIRWDESVHRSSCAVLDDAWRAFDTAAVQRIEEVATSREEKPAPAGFGQPESTSAAGFAFALRSLAAVAPYASDGIAAALRRWHDREIERARGDGSLEKHDDAAMKEAHQSAVNCVFCESMLATLSAGAEPFRDKSQLDGVQELALEFFRLRSDSRQREVARRPLLALDCRSEEVMWTELLRALCRAKERGPKFFEKFTEKVLVHLENTGGDRRRGRSVAPDAGTLAMCSALQAVQLPGRLGGCGGSRSSVSAGRLFFEGLNRLIAKSGKALHAPVARHLGQALLEQLLREAADMAGALSGGVAAPAEEAAALETARISLRLSDAHSETSDAVIALHRMQLQLAEWANKRVGMPRKLTAKFGSWAAPLATALLCMRRFAHAIPRTPSHARHALG